MQDGQFNIDPFLLGLDKKKNGKPEKETIKVKEKEVVSDDPFMLGVKKKETSDTITEDLESGTEKTSPSNLPSPFQFQRQIPRTKPIEANQREQTSVKNPSITLNSGLSFLDADIEKRYDESLLNPELYKPNDKFSLRNIYYQNRNNQFLSQKEGQKSLIKSSPEALLNYNQKRIKEIDDHINYLQQQRNDLRDYTYTDPLSTFEPSPTDKKKDDELNSEIVSANFYKNSLKGSIANEAANLIVPKYLESPSAFKPRELGREVVAIADPQQELIYKQAEQNGGSLPAIQNSQLERLGLDVTKNYLSRLPKNENTQFVINEINNYEKDFDERNFELTAQRVREKLGKYFYDAGKGGFFGYSSYNIEKAINDPATGLTDSEKKIALEYVLPTENKLFFSTDIPGSGFFRSAKNAIERSAIGTVNTISGLVGQRDDADRAYDLLNAENEESRFRAPGESPSMKSQLNYLNYKEEKGTITDAEKKEKQELQKYVDIRSWWMKQVDGVGDLTGQVVEMALLTKGLGGLGRLATLSAEGGGLLGGLTRSAAGTILSNETTGLVINGFLNSYDNYKQQAIQLMPGNENAADRNAYATTMGVVEGLSERIFNDVKVLKAFTKGVSPSVVSITKRFINNEITSQVAKEELQSTLVKYLKPFGKEFIKSEFQESFEEGVVDIADGIAQTVYGGQDFDIAKTGNKALNTFLTTALYSPLVSGMAAHGAHRQNQTQNAFFKSAIVDMARNPTPYLESVGELQLNGQITQAEANEKIKLINSGSKYLKDIPKTVNVSQKNEQGEDIITQKELDYPEISSYLIHRLNEGILNEKLEKTTDPVLQNQLEQQIKRSVDIRQGIVNGNIGVMPTIEPVTDNPKVAQELGISEVSQMPADDLIGTPFQKENKGEQPEQARQPEEIESELKDQLGEEKTKQISKEVSEFIDNDLLPQELPEAEKTEAKTRPLGFLKAVAEQAQTPLEFEGKTIDTRGRTVEKYGEEVVKLAEETFPKPIITPEGIATPIKEESKFKFPIPSKPVEDMTSSELNEHIENVSKYEKDTKLTKEEEKKLTKQESDDYYGKNLPESGVYDKKELQRIYNRVSEIEQAQTAEEISSWIKRPLIDYSRKKDTENLSILKAAKRRADELGISSTDLIKESFNKVSNELKDIDVVKSIFSNIEEPTTVSEGKDIVEETQPINKPSTTEAPLPEPISKDQVPIFEAISKADKSKISKKEKTNAINKAVEKYGEQGNKAALIHSNFDDIVKQLKENKKLEVICK